MKVGLVCMYGLSQSVRSINDAFIRNGDTVEVFTMFPEEIRAQKTEDLVQFDGDMIFTWQGIGCDPRVIAEKNIPTMIWNFDDPHRIMNKSNLEILLAHDYILTCDEGSVDRYAKINKRAIWLPPAADPAYFNTQYDATQACDISYLGRGYHKAEFSDMLVDRIRLMDKVYSKPDYNIEIWSHVPDSWDKLSPKVKGALDHDQAHVKFKNTKINLNAQVSNKSAYKYINERIPMVLAAGGFIMIDTTPGLRTWLEDGKHVVYYKSISDCLDKIEYYLNHDEERLKIAAAGHEFIKNNWTYDHFVKKIRSII